eukprot:scaffold181_cov10-Tisochrysis_lutea.AAC.1
MDIDIKSLKGGKLLPFVFREGKCKRVGNPGSPALHRGMASTEIVLGKKSGSLQFSNPIRCQGW